MSEIQSQVEFKFNPRFNKQLLCVRHGLLHSLSMISSAPAASLGERIKSRLSHLGGSREGYTQRWLAEQLQVSNEAVSKWIHGKADPSLSNLRALAKTLRCSIGFLAGDVADDRIAEVVLIMESTEANNRDSILAGVRAVAATLPTAKSPPKKRAA